MVDNCGKAIKNSLKKGFLPPNLLSCPQTNVLFNKVIHKELFIIFNLCET